MSAAATSSAVLAQQKMLQNRAQYTPAEYYAALGIDLSARNPEEMPLTAEEQGPMAEFSQMIIYSSRYSDDKYEYRHVQLPKEMLKLIPERFFSKKTGLFKLLWEKEWRSLGIVQSLGWEHYEVHKPEPHLLLFKKLL